MSTIRLPRPDVMLVGTRVGSGPPILLLHAGGEDRRVWAPVASRLAEGGFTTIAYDQRDHGDSDTGDAESLPPFAHDVAAMLDATQPDAIVVGASLGGFAALLALADRSLERRVAGLVLVDVVPDPPAERTRRYLRAAIGQRADSRLVADILVRGRQLSQIASRLTLPVLLIRGGIASPLADEDVARLATNLSQLQIDTIGSAGHLVARDAPGLLAERLLRFSHRVHRTGRADEFGDLGLPVADTQQVRGESVQ